MKCDKRFLEFTSIQLLKMSIIFKNKTKEFFFRRDLNDAVITQKFRHWIYTIKLNPISKLIVEIEHLVVMLCFNSLKSFLFDVFFVYIRLIP